MGVLTALGEILSPQYLLMMIAGTIGGIMIGAMPGLTSVMGVTLLLPFTYGMDPAAGISMLLAISFGAIYGGSITAILIGTPGTPASEITPAERPARIGRTISSTARASVVCSFSSRNSRLSIGRPKPAFDRKRRAERTFSTMK